jgi:hypothetical protein
LHRDNTPTVKRTEPGNINMVIFLKKVNISLALETDYGNHIIITENLNLKVILFRVILTENKVIIMTAAN